MLDPLEPDNFSGAYLHGELQKAIDCINTLIEKGSSVAKHSPANVDQFVRRSVVENRLTVNTKAPTYSNSYTEEGDGLKEGDVVEDRGNGFFLVRQALGNMMYTADNYLKDYPDQARDYFAKQQPQEVQSGHDTDVPQDNSRDGDTQSDSPSTGV